MRSFAHVRQLREVSLEWARVAPVWEGCPILKGSQIVWFIQQLCILRKWKVGKELDGSVTNYIVCCHTTAIHQRAGVRSKKIKAASQKKLISRDPLQTPKQPI